MFLNLIANGTDLAKRNFVKIWFFQKLWYLKEKQISLKYMYFKNKIAD